MRREEKRREHYILTDNYSNLPFQKYFLQLSIFNNLLNCNNYLVANKKRIKEFFK